MTQKLKLHSPVGSDPLILKWPVPTSEGKDGPEEILDTIRLVCDDYPELKTPLETRILKDGEDVSTYDFEQTKAMCERYNKAIDSLRQLVKGHPRQKSVSKQASMKQLKHILQQCYNHSVKDPEKLNHYEPFSPEVYGETSFELVEQMIKYVKFSESDYFIDLGSGVGQVVLQVSAATNCKFCYGVEKAEWPAEYAQVLEKEFKKWMKWFGKEHGDFKIEKGDFLHDDIKEKLNKATIVFVNNFAFGPVVDHELKQRFANCLKEGARIVSSKAFCPLNFRITARNLSDIGTIMQVEELSPLCGAVSWTGKPFAYYVHTIDRTLLEKYFQRLRFPSQKNEDEPRKDRKGRPLLSIKDKINGALSGGSDSNSSGRWRRVKGVQRETETASPLCAAKVLDFDSGSNSSFTNSAIVPAVEETSIVYGPTTRRQWNEYVKRPQSLSGTENDNDSSAADANSVDLKPKDQAKEVTQKKKKMKSVKRLNNGALGMRKMQVGKKITEPVKSKAAVKLRPRKKQVVRSSLSSKRAGSVAAAAAVAASTASGVSTTTSTVCSNPSSAHTNGMVTPSLDSLNLLHAHTIMSTSGKDPAEKVNYNDRRMTETSSAYFKPTVQKQTVSMLEKEAGFLHMIEAMKQRFLSFLTFMQTPEYRAMLLLQIEQEKRKNSTLRNQTDSLEKDISVLQKEGVRLIKERLKEMGIKADTPRELISQAKDIMLRHHELKSQTASLGAQINALQTEHTHKVMAYRKVLDRKLAMRHPENGFSENSLHVDKERLDQQILLASINRLHTEIQHLQNVNKPYVVRPETLNGVDVGLNLVHESKGVVKGKGPQDQSGVNSYIAKEKLDMKENYDAFGTVLAMVKKELTSTLQSSPACQSGVQVAKLEPGQVVEAQNDTKQDTVEKPQSINVDMKSNGTTFCVKNANASSAHCNKVQSFKAPEIVAKDVSDVNTSVSQISSSSSSSWTSELRKDGIVTSASPRILPPGMKIDIKKPSRLNGLNSALKARVASATSYTILQNPDSILNQGYKVNPNGSFNTVPTFNLYTENEKSAAEDLILLKESLNTSASSIELQGSALNKVPVSSPSSSSLSSSLSGMEYVQGHANDATTSSRRHSSHDKQMATLVTDKLHTGSSNSLSKDSSVSCAISTSSTPHVFAQVPAANFSQIGSSGQMAGQNNQKLSTATSSIAQSNVKIITNQPKNGLIKHKNYDTSLIHRPIKVRPLEAGSDVKLGVSSVPASAFRAQHQTQVVQSAPSGAPLAHHVLKSEPGSLMSSQSFLNAHMSPAVASGSAPARSLGSGSLPFVTIQSPHAMPASQGNNGVEPSLLKILGQKPMVISPNNNSVFNGAVCNNSNSASLAMSSAIAAHVSSAQSDTVGQGVKILPQNGRDPKGGLRSPEASCTGMSEFGACEPVSSPEHERRCCSSGTCQECVPTALPPEGVLDSSSDSSQGVNHDQLCSPDTCTTRKRRKCGRSLKLIISQEGVPLKVSRLSSDCELGCTEATSRTDIVRAAAGPDVEAVSVKEKTGCSSRKTNASVLVMLKREAKLDRMVESISSCNHRGKKPANTESLMYPQDDTVLLNGKSEPNHVSCDESEEEELLRGTGKGKEFANENLVFHTDVTSSQLMFSTIDCPVGCKFSQPFSAPGNKDLKLPEMNNSSLLVDKTKSSRRVGPSSDSHISRKDKPVSECYRHQRRCSLHRNRHNPLRKSQRPECTTASLPKQTSRTTENSRKTLSVPHANSSSYINDQGKISEQQENKLVRPGNKCTSAKSDASKLPPKRNHSSGYCIDTNIYSASDIVNGKCEKQSLSIHNKSQRCRGSSVPKSPTSLTKESYSAVHLGPTSHRHHRTSDNNQRNPSKSCQSSFQDHVRHTSCKGKTQTINQDSSKKNGVSSGVRIPSCQEKRQDSAKSSRNHSSYKEKDMSPGPPKLERAVTPPPSHQRRYTTSKMLQNTGKCDSFIAHSDLDLLSQLNEQVPVNSSDYSSASKSPRSTSSSRTSRRSECHSLTKESLLQGSQNRLTPDTQRNSSSPTVRRHSKPGSKELLRKENTKEKDPKFLGAISQRLHKISSETVQSQLKDKIKSKHVSCSKAASGSVSRCNSKSHLATIKYDRSSEESSSMKGSSRSESQASCDRTSEVSKCKQVMESSEAYEASPRDTKETKTPVKVSTKRFHEGHSAIDAPPRDTKQTDTSVKARHERLPHTEVLDALPRDTKQTDTSVKVRNERLPHTEVHDAQPDSECTLSANLDSPYSMLTPMSICQNNQMDEDKNADCSGAEVFEHNENKYSVTHATVMGEGSTVEIHPKDKLESDDIVVNISAPDAESFPFPPTPGKTPRSASVPCSPCTEINNWTGGEANEIPPEEVKPDPGNNPVRKGPQTPPGSPLFNHQSQSRSRSLSVSSSSSRGSSCDSCQSTSSSSSFTDSSSDRKKRRKRKYQHLKTPTRKLSTLMTQTLGMGSPPKATALYSPMPSPVMNGLNYGTPGRLGIVGSGTAPGFGNHGAAVASSILSPLSISTQQSPGYQMVTSDSLRSPSGSLRSPVSGSLVKQHLVFPGALLSPVSTVPPVSSSSHLALKDSICDLSCKPVSSKELHGGCKKNMIGTPDYKYDQAGHCKNMTATPDYKYDQAGHCKNVTATPDNKYDKADISLPGVTNVLSVSNRLSLGAVDTHPADFRAKLTAKEDAVSSTLDVAIIVKDHNGNNTTVRCSHSSHLQQAHAAIDYNKNICQLPPSLCPTSTSGSKLGATLDAKCTGPLSDSASLSCTSHLKSQLAPTASAQLVPTTSGTHSTSGAVSSYSDQGACAGMTTDKTTQPSSCLFTNQLSSSSSCMPTTSTKDNSFKIGEHEPLPVHGRKSNISYLTYGLKKELQYNPLPSAQEQPSSVGHSQQTSLLPQSKRQPHLSQSCEQLHKPFQPTPSPPLPHQQLQHTQRQVRPKGLTPAPHSGHFNPHLNHSYKSHNLGNRRAGLGFRLPLSHNAPPPWGHMSSPVYPGPYCPNGSTLLNRPRHVPPVGPIPGFREDNCLPEHVHNGIMDYPLHGALTQPFGSGQWDHSAPLYCMGSGPGGLGRSVSQQHYNRSYHHKHH